MKTIVTCLAVSVLLSSVAHAGWGWNKEKFHGSKSHVVEQRITSASYCYDAGFEFSAFGSGFWPETQTGLNTDSLGGGVALAYFFNHNLGLEGTYAVHGGGEAQQVGKINAVYRFPLGGECCSTIAPYVFGGFGVVSAGPSESLWNLGGGLDVRFEGWGCVALFSDFSYNWVDQSLPDFTMIRAGIRFPF